MVKLASAREARAYGARAARNRAEYVNAGLYLFATVLLLGGFAAELFSAERRSGLVVLMMGLLLVAAVNGHDMVAHLAGLDYRVGLVEYDAQLALVEFAVPLVQALGSLLLFLAMLFIFIREDRGEKYTKLEGHAVNMLVAGPILWVVGSIHNSCQIYERADGHLQILQQGVHIPFLIASVLFTVAAIVNAREQAGAYHHGLQLLGKTWIWLGLFGDVFLMIGGFMNLVKVFKMQQGNGSLRLERLRGGAQDRLARHRERHVPLIFDDHRRRRRQAEEEAAKLAAEPSTTYKDVLVGEAQA